MINEGDFMTRTEMFEETLARADEFFAALTEAETERREELLAELDAIYWHRQKVEDELRALNKTAAARAAKKRRSAK
jgi:hypothetical protein